MYLTLKIKDLKDTKSKSKNIVPKRIYPLLRFYNLNYNYFLHYYYFQLEIYLFRK